MDLDTEEISGAQSPPLVAQSSSGLSNRDPGGQSERPPFGNFERFLSSIVDRIKTKSPHGVPTYQYIQSPRARPNSLQ